eukprot:scaffold1323_cov160-Amphora_coffeaeformis.AAC.10
MLQLSKLSLPTLRLLITIKEEKRPYGRPWVSFHIHLINGVLVMRGGRLSTGIGFDKCDLAR